MYTMSNLVVTILAGGEGKRMNSNIPKVLHLFTFGGEQKPMLVRIIEVAMSLAPKKIVVVTGKFHNTIIQTLSKYMDIFGIRFVEQPEPKGTGHAVSCCLDHYDDDDNILILNGDMPLITNHVLNKFLWTQPKETKGCHIMTARLENPFGYGRIIYDNDKFIGIVEEKDCTDQQRAVDIVNSGMYLVNGNVLKQFIPMITDKNIQREFYLTDIVKLIRQSRSNVEVSTFLISEVENNFIKGVNTHAELASLEQMV